IINSGQRKINGCQFKWVIETHKNRFNSNQIHSYVFLTYQNNKTFILTMVTISSNFISTQKIFEEIGNSLNLNE
ncbi:MAG: hypothetical protein ACRCVT_13735, partial [Leadbetterella sp.]